VTEGYGGWGLADQVAAVQTALRQIADDVEAVAADVAERMRARNEQGDHDAVTLSAKVSQVESLTAVDGTLRRLLRDSAARWREEEAEQGRRIASDLAVVAARADGLRRAIAALHARLQEATVRQAAFDARLVSLGEFEEQVVGQVAAFGSVVERIRSIVAGVRALQRELQS
jgi:hypothetical protein